MEDWIPTIMAALGQPDLKEKLLKGHDIGGKTYKVYLDGYDQTDILTGKGPTKRKDFYYFTETTLHGNRYGNWKFLFMEQDKCFDGLQNNLATLLITNLISILLSASMRLVDSTSGRRFARGRLAPPPHRSASLWSRFRTIPRAQQASNWMWMSCYVPPSNRAAVNHFAVCERTKS